MPNKITWVLFWQLKAQRASEGVNVAVRKLAAVDVCCSWINMRTFIEIQMVIACALEG